MSEISVRFKTPNKHRKGWHDDHEYIDHQSASVTEAIQVVKEKYPEAYDINAKVYNDRKIQTS